SEMSRAANLLKLPCPHRLRPELLAAVGQLGVVTGALLFDSHQHQLADRVLAFATACAEDGGDWHLRAKSLSWRARQAVWVGDAEGALTLAQLGLVRRDRLTATEQAMLFTAVARAHGRRGDVDATLQAVGEADDAFARANPDDDVPWMAYYDHAQHCGDTGHALAELAVHGVRVEETAHRLATAVDEHPDSYVRSRAISGFKLAAITMRTGDPDHAVEIARAAVGDAEGVLSKRLHRTASEVAQSARLHQHDRRDEVAEVLETVRTVGVAS
ncbi:XRE family transcriptional regulator, partial [Nocardioides sp. NPDC057772]|uniref:XRE family transcriptional regulator n=1 Tax=Nocardioides sp. NPDC057772 TaxID=3346245 RepID=UPI00366DAC8B